MAIPIPAVAWVAGITCAAAYAQEARPPAFEVASIKPNKSGAVRAQFRPEPGRLTVTNFSLKFIMEQAYGLRGYQIVGGPGWLDSDKFDIVAKAEGNADKHQVRLMLEPLLADRFKLAVHRETREMLVYELVVAKGGPRLQDAEGRKPPPRSTAETQVGRVIGSASVFADWLSGRVGRPVFDKTGISGNHNFTLVMRRDAPLSAAEDPASALANSSVPASIFGALEEQYGLKLQSRKAPVEVLVIDHVEKPSEN